MYQNFEAKETSFRRLAVDSTSIYGCDCWSRWTRMGVAAHFYSSRLCIIACIWGKSPESVHANWWLFARRVSFCEAGRFASEARSAGKALYRQCDTFRLLRHFIHTAVKSFRASTIALAFPVLNSVQHTLSAFLISTMPFLHLTSTLLAQDALPWSSPNGF